MMHGMQNMMKQAQQLQKKMMKMQDELAEKEYEAASGGDMVKVKINGRLEVKSVTLAKEIVNPDDVEMLEDLVVAATNGAIKMVQEAQNDSMSSLTGGMKIPGLNM